MYTAVNITTIYLCCSSVRSDLHFWNHSLAVEVSSPGAPLKLEMLLITLTYVHWQVSRKHTLCGEVGALCSLRHVILSLPNPTKYFTMLNPVYQQHSLAMLLLDVIWPCTGHSALPAPLWCFQFSYNIWKAKLSDRCNHLVHVVPT